MLSKEDILKILKKYGFYSLNRAPYLYQDEENIGVYFVWPNKQYGNLERVIYFTDELNAEEEIYKYWWFTNNKEKYSLEVIFDDYEIVNPNIIYKYKTSIINRKEMRNFDTFLKNYIDPKEDMTKKELKRTIDILLMIIKEKFKMQNNTYNQVTTLEETLRNLKNTYLEKLKTYKKDKNKIKPEQEVLMDNTDNTEELINNFYLEVNKLSNLDEMRDFIDTLVNYIKEIDLNESHFQNIYLLNKYPYEIEDMKKKITILDQHLSLRRKIFKGKKDCLEELASVDQNSKCNEMITLNSFIEQELNKNISFYEEKKEVSEEFLGDYMVEFLNLNLELPERIKNNGYTEEIDQKRLLIQTKKYYEKLSEKEKSACVVASSFLKEALSILIRLGANNELNISELISKIILNQKIDLFNNAYQALDYFNNTNIRVKYLSIIKMNSFETFIASLVEVIRILKGIEIKLDKSFFAYFATMDKEIIPLYLKNVFYHSRKTSYIGIINPKTPFYYSPIEIVLEVDILDNNELIVRDMDMIFILKEKIKTERKSDKLVVVKYEKENSFKTKDYVVVNSMKEKNRCNYYENMIYNKSEE